jgi:hypothetical protein
MRSATFIAIFAVLLAFVYAGVIEEVPEKVIVGDGGKIAKTGVDSTNISHLMTETCTLSKCHNWCFTQMSPPFGTFCNGHWCSCRKP